MTNQARAQHAEVIKFFRQIYCLVMAMIVIAIVIAKKNLDAVIAVLHGQIQPPRNAYLAQGVQEKEFRAGVKKMEILAKRVEVVADADTSS